MGKGVDLICRLDFTNGQHNNLKSSWNTGPGQESPFVIYFNDQILNGIIRKLLVKIISTG